MFETDRLIVRHFRPADLDDFAALCADPVAMRYMGDGTTLPRSEVARWIEVCQRKYADRGYGTSAVFEKQSGSFIGFCGVVRAPDRDFDEIVYGYHVSAWGKGYATEAARAMLTYVFERSSLARIYATIHPENSVSIRLVEKLGFRFERSLVDDDGSPEVDYSVERDWWVGQQKTPVG